MSWKIGPSGTAYYVLDWRDVRYNSLTDPALRPGRCGSDACRLGFVRPPGGPRWDQIQCPSCGLRATQSTWASKQTRNVLVLDREAARALAQDPAAQITFLNRRGENGPDTPRFASSLQVAEIGDLCAQTYDQDEARRLVLGPVLRGRLLNWLTRDEAAEVIRRLSELRDKREKAGARGGEWPECLGTWELHDAILVEQDRDRLGMLNAELDARLTVALGG